MGVAVRLSGTVSPFLVEQGTSLETQWRAMASSCQEVGPTWFSRVAAGFSSYDGVSGSLLGWPWEAQSSPRVARESWGLRLGHCRAEETSPRRVSGT